jgi:DNA-binding transcriptional ArsR family regulator
MPLAGPLPRVLAHSGRPALVVYPMPAALSSVGTVDTPADALTRLLGASRAAILSTVAGPGRHTTSSLARAVRISVSSTSEHTAALRAAGLITSQRDGTAVLHRPTPLARRLVYHNASTCTV